MSTMSLYVIANGDLFREAFNAIVTVLGTSTFNTAFRLAILFAVFGVTFSYIKSRDITVLGKWFLLYFLVTAILLGPKINIEIIDSSDPGAVYTVGNVPYGLGFPASLITTVAHSLIETMEDAFHMPDDTSYSKTGMLFGSRLFKLSTGFHIVDPNVRFDFDQYVKNCVTGDILINKKYSFADLVKSNDLWSTITQNPSPVRGIVSHDGTFMSCRDAVPVLKTELTEDVKNNGLVFFGERIFGGKDASKAALKLQQYLPLAYKYYANLSKSAEDITTQNVLMNAIRSGIINYATEAGASAALLNLSSTQALGRMRMAWGTSKNMATYVLPILQTDILLLLLCLFPIVILLSIQPVFGINVFKHYLYSLLWVESWPLLFSCLNLAVTFYLQNKTGALANGGITLSNSNQLALEHSDVANMAGYLMTCVPFIAIGVVRGMAFAFNNAANYIGGMMHSTASSTSAEAVTGNISLGNTSLSNVNANKWDTNSTYMHGMATEQLANGALVMHTASGHDVWNVSPAISHLATNVNASSLASESLASHAENSLSAATQNQNAFNHSITSAASTMEQFGKNHSTGHSMGENYSDAATATVAQHASDMHGLVQTVAERNGVTWNEAFKGMTSFSQGVSGEAGASTPMKGVSVWSAGGKANLGLQHSRSSDESTAHDVSSHLNISNDEAKRFNEDWGAMKNYTTNNHAEILHSTSSSEMSQLAADFRQADSAAHSYTANLTDSERFSHLASFSEQHADQIQSNFNQGFAEYVQGKEPERANHLLGNTDNLRAAEERQALAERYIRSGEFGARLETLYQKESANINPEQIYKSGSDKMPETGRIGSEFQGNATGIKGQAEANGSGFNTKKFSETKDKVIAGEQDVDTHVKAADSERAESYQKVKDVLHEEIKEGSQNADRVSFSFGSIKPDYINKKEK